MLGAEALPKFAADCERDRARDRANGRSDNAKLKHAAKLTLIAALADLDGHDFARHGCRSRSFLEQKLGKMSERNQPYSIEEAPRYTHRQIEKVRHHLTVNLKVRQTSDCRPWVAPF